MAASPSRVIGRLTVFGISILRAINTHCECRFLTRSSGRSMSPTTYASGSANSGSTAATST